MSGDWPEGFGREVRDSLDSTSAELLRRAANGARGPLWLLAREQTDARGRRGRAWRMPCGNFAASRLTRPGGPPSALALRSFVAAVGLHDALVAVMKSDAGLSLKWPNDVLLDECKLAGILLETGGAVGQDQALVIGIGVNLATAPAAETLEQGALPPISLRAARGLEVSAEAFLDLLAPRIAFWEARLVTEGFAPVRAAWLSRAARIGENVTARLPGRTITGLFETIDPTGALVVATDRGHEILHSAEVHFPTDPSLRREPVDAARN